MWALKAAALLEGVNPEVPELALEAVFFLPVTIDFVPFSDSLGHGVHVF